MIGVEKFQTRRRSVGIDDPHVFTNRGQDFGHPQLAAQRIAVGADMADQDERLMTIDVGFEIVPVNAHDDPMEGEMGGEVSARCLTRAIS